MEYFTEMLPAFLIILCLGVIAVVSVGHLPDDKTARQHEHRDMEDGN